MDTLRNGVMVCMACGTVALPAIVAAPAPHHARTQWSTPVAFRQALLYHNAGALGDRKALIHIKVISN
jgi:hypothetical protein